MTATLRHGSPRARAGFVYDYSEEMRAGTAEKKNRDSTRGTRRMTGKKRGKWEKVARARTPAHRRRAGPPALLLSSARRRRAGAPTPLLSPADRRRILGARIGARSRAGTPTYVLPHVKKWGRKFRSCRYSQRTKEEKSDPLPDLPPQKSAGEGIGEEPGDQTTNRNESPLRTILPADGVPKWVPKTSTPLSAYFSQKARRVFFASTPSESKLSSHSG